MGHTNGGESVIGPWPMAYKRCLAFVMLACALGVFIQFASTYNLKRAEANPM